MKKILIIGATSAIAQACARRWAQRGDRLCLVARNPDALQGVVDDLRTRGANRVTQEVLDVSRLEVHGELLERAAQSLDGLDMVLIAHGTLSDQAKAESDVAYALKEIEVNGTSVVSLMTVAAQLLARQGHGCIGVISSVAGDRGRQSNYAYGSAKALVTAFASGLRQRLSKMGVAVVTIKPGFVDTPMTAHIGRKGALWAQPAKVAEDIVSGMDAGKPVIYTPGFWRWIMMIIRHVPERVFMKLKL